MHGKNSSSWRILWKKVRHAVFGRRPVSERRGWIRYPCDIKNYFQSESGANEMRVPARIRDLSRTGVKMVVSQSFETGTKLKIELEKASGGRSRLLSARVTRAIFHADHGKWILGCAFTQKLSEEDLHTLLTK